MHLLNNLLHVYTAINCQTSMLSRYEDAMLSRYEDAMLSRYEDAMLSR